MFLDRFFHSQSAEGEGGMNKLLMWDIWQCSECQSSSTTYFCYVSCTARGLYKTITCPLKTNNVHADTQCSVARNHPVCGEQNFFALGPVSPIMTFNFLVPRKLKVLYLANVLPVPSQAAVDQSTRLC